jgi:hypothetical protein
MWLQRDGDLNSRPELLGRSTAPTTAPYERRHIGRFAETFHHSWKQTSGKHKTLNKHGAWTQISRISAIFLQWSVFRVGCRWPEIGPSGRED